MGRAQQQSAVFTRLHRGRRAQGAGRVVGGCCLELPQSWPLSDFSTVELLSFALPR